MNRAEVNGWRNKNGTGRTEWKYFNSLSYFYVWMLDNWIAIFEYNNISGKYTPLIQCRDEEHADSYCTMREPVTVPMEAI